jgi:hypothetical protein
MYKQCRLWLLSWYFLAIPLHLFAATKSEGVIDEFVSLDSMSKEPNASGTKILVPLSNEIKFLVYGACGIIAEVFFTALKARESILEGSTQLWIVPLYGFGGLIIEHAIKDMPYSTPVRALLHVANGWTLEFLGGLTALALTKRVPWEYKGRTKFAWGILNGAHAPVWMALGLFAEWAIPHVANVHYRA